MVRMRVLVGTALIAAAVPLVVVMACGPDFEPDVFVPARHPESPARFASGQLGVMQPGYARADLVVAYRYLHGGQLSKEEQAIYAPPKEAVTGERDWQAINAAAEAAKPENRWLAARAEFVKNGIATAGSIGQNRVIETQRQGYVQRDDLLNCTDGAFQTAVVTLEARAKAWGPQSADLQEWVRGQDQVFSNCTKTGGVPQAAPSGASDLLKADRAYQIAAAHFYAGRFDDAVTEFEAIGTDKSSPWSRWGEYLAARSEVRKAAMIAPVVEGSEQAQFDTATLRKAAARLGRVRDAASDAKVKHAAEAELAFVQVRLEPQKRLNDVATALGGPKPDAEFAQHLADLLFLTGHGTKGDADLARWISHDKSASELKDWKTVGTLPWLVTAISSAKGNRPEAAELIVAAAKVPAESPGYVTVTYHRTRLLLESGRQDEARELAGSLLASLHGDGTVASRNAVLAIRMQTARTYAEFLGDAPRIVIETNSQASNSALCSYAGANKKIGDCVKKIPPQEFDGDAAQTFNREIPLSRWVEAAGSSILPQHLREAVALAAWMRAVGLNDSATVKRVQAMLPEDVRRTSGESTGFPATLTMLRNPGLRPYLQQGTQRSLSYRQLDNFRDNWWCAKWGDAEAQQSIDDAISKPPESTIVPTNFLTKTEKTVAEDERNKLNELPGGISWMGKRAIAYVKEHPTDKDGAEALGLTVRMTRYGCFSEKDEDRKEVSKEAFQMLHRLYPKSVWADRTPYYYQ